VIALVGLTDVIFAVDSIPAIFAITTDPFIVLTSNIFAILGLRAMYFLLAAVATKFHLLSYGLAVILVFIGTKMLLIDVYKIPVLVSLGVVRGHPARGVLRAGQGNSTSSSRSFGVRLRCAACQLWRRCSAETALGMATARRVEQVAHVVAIEIADAPVADQATLLQDLEAVDRVLQGDTGTPMQEVQIEVVQLQAAQARLACGDQAGRVGMLGQRLGHDEEVLACDAVAHGTSHGLADHGFRAAGAVHLGGIDDAIADLESQAKCGDFLHDAARRFAHAPGSQPQGRHILPVGQSDFARRADAGIHHAMLVAGMARAFRVNAALSWLP
jgi:hypothetical protein